MSIKTDQQLFASGLATYQKVLDLNYMAHKEVYGLLRRVLQAEARDGFVFLDVACGTAVASAAALKDSRIGRYIGVDISEPSLEVAEQAVKAFECPTELRCQNFVQAIRDWNEPVDVVWVGQSLHHLARSEKQVFMDRVCKVLSSNGLFMIWEPTCLAGEDREGWFRRFLAMRPHWAGVTDEEFAAFDSHQRASDYAEDAATWIAMATQAGFRQADELLIVPNRLARVFRFRR